MFPFSVAADRGDPSLVEPPNGPLSRSLRAFLRGHRERPIERIVPRDLDNHCHLLLDEPSPRRPLS